MQYELAVVIDPKEDEKMTQDKLTTLLTKEGFSVSNVASLGKKPLAYPLKKRTEGRYLIFSISGTANPALTETKFKQDDMVLRTLVLKHEVKSEKLKVKNTS